jgi:hypothetical protein
VRIAANHRAIQRACLELFRAGHLAVNGEDLALPTFDQRRRDGRWTTDQRETYDRGSGATLLPYDPARRTVLLTRQFRFPAYVNGSPTGCSSRPPPGCSTTRTPPPRSAARPPRSSVWRWAHWSTCSTSS